jgi:hypothetical protein
MFNGVKHFLTEKSDSDKEKNKKGLKLFIGEYFKLQFASFFILLSFAVFFLTKLILCAGSEKKTKKKLFSKHLYHQTHIRISARLKCK